MCSTISCGKSEWPFILVVEISMTKRGVKQCWFLTSDPLAPTPRHQHAVALSTNSTQQVRIPKKVLHLIGLRPSSLDEWAIGRMASWLIIKQSTDCKSLNLIYTFMFWKWSIINMFLQLVEAFNKMGYFKLLKLSSRMLQEHSFYHCCQRKVWPVKSRQMSLKVAQKWFH